MTEPEAAVSFGTSYDHFSEKKEVCSLIDSLPAVYQDLRSLEMCTERLTAIVDKYQEQPHLLDPHLNEIISDLFKVVLQQDVPPPLMHLGFKYIYLFSKVRGPKIIVRLFSHEVADLEPTLKLLQQQDMSDYNTWETRYVLLLWLYVISMIPFDLSRMDGSGGHAHSRTIDRLLDIGKLYLGVTDKSRDAAVLLCARLLSRPDVQKLKLVQFLEWASDTLMHTNDSSMLGTSVLSGVIKTLATLFKISKREDLLPHVDLVFSIVLKCGFSSSSNTLIRKLSLKLIQRVGMTLLPAQLLSWRYGRGSRSLDETLASKVGKKESPLSNGAVVAEEQQKEEEEGFDVPEEIEDIIGQLLNGLKDKDTVVRWSAAKGVGRITGRLPLELANEIVGSLLELFSSNEDDSGWHGGCLALAELGRRGLLLPERLGDVVPVVLKALVYDQRRGSYSVGSHVRDAACYVCWSFARAYNPSQLKPHVKEIAQELVVTMLFDREVNCRRAASAAFQENVGRQGTFPHGIDILTIADYFAVGNISHVYLEVSIIVGGYNEYTRPLIDHLVNHKIQHWDSSLRELVSRALHNLTFLDPSYVASSILPGLIDQVTFPDLWIRHGSLYAVAEIVYSLYLIEQKNSDPGSLLSMNLLKSWQGVAHRLVAGDVFKGISGDVMRPAALKFIERSCLSHLPVNEEILEVWQAIIDDNIPHTQDHIREAAVNTLRVLCENYYCLDHVTVTRAQGILIPKYIKQLKSSIRFARMGFALALGHLPPPLLQGQLDTVLVALSSAASLTGHSGLPVHTEARRDAIKALSGIAAVMGLSLEGPSSDHLVAVVFQAMFEGMRDYTIDSRGDIGTIVREACICGLEALCIKLSDECPKLLTHDAIQQTMQLIFQQCNEKIDRTRTLACQKMMSLIGHQPSIEGLPHHQELLSIFNSKSVADINWSATHSSFPLTVQLLSLPTYSYHTLLGLVVSVGGLTYSLVHYSSMSLLKYLKGISRSPERMSTFTANILKVFDDNKNDARVIIPLLKTLDLLLGNGVFEVFLDTKNGFPQSLFDKLKQELKGCKDPVKILASINTLCSLLQFVDVRQPTLNQLMLLLGHAYPKVRRTTADQLYVTLLTYEDILPEEKAELVMGLLTETSWDGAIESVRIQRNELCNILKLPIPKSKTGTKSKKTKTQDQMGYRDLVDRMGY